MSVGSRVNHRWPVRAVEYSGAVEMSTPQRHCPTGQPPATCGHLHFKGLKLKMCLTDHNPSAQLHVASGCGIVWGRRGQCHLQDGPALL